MSTEEKFFSETHKQRIAKGVSGNKNYNFGRFREKSTNWHGGRSGRICEVCGKRFYVKQCVVKKGLGRCCSLSCSAKAQRYNAKPYMTAPERTFESICIKNNLPFNFVGDGSLWLDNANPDFVHNTKKIVVEVFGDYWHSPLLNFKLKKIGTLEGRKKQLKVAGYKSIFIWESDLKRKDAEAFVKHLMQKGKII